MNIICDNCKYVSGFLTEFPCNRCVVIAINCFVPSNAALNSEELAATVPPVGAANNARLEIAEKLLTQWHKYWNHTAGLTTAEAVDLQNATYSFIKSSATSPVA